MSDESELPPPVRENSESTSQAPLDAASVFREYHDSVLHHLERIVPLSEAEDLTQEVFVKVSRHLEDFQGRSSLSTWLHQIATRTALDHLKSRGFRQAKSTLSIEASEESSQAGEAQAPILATSRDEEASHRVIKQEMHGCVREHIERLPTEYREVLMLKDIEGLKNREIAARLGLTLDATKIRLHRARKAMKSSLDGGCDFYRTEENTLACDRKTGANDQSTGCTC